MKRRNTRLYIDSHIRAKKLIALNVEQSHYIKNVMRHRDKDHIIIFNTENGEWTAEIRIDKKGVDVLPVSQVKSGVLSNSIPKLVLCFAPTKKYGEFVVEKATELGVDMIVPLLTERSVVDKINIERYHKAALEAAEQSGRITVPTISNMTRLCDLTSNMDKLFPNYAKQYVVCDIHNKNCITPSDLSRFVCEDKILFLIIGPEGGFSDTDRRSFKDDFVFLKMGDLVLRAETATIAALALATSVV